MCGTFNSLGKAACASKQIPEFTLQQVTANVLGQNDFTHEWLCDRIQHIRVCNDNTLIFCLYQNRCPVMVEVTGLEPAASCSQTDL